jgi:hypothetical protein
VSRGLARAGRDERAALEKIRSGACLLGCGFGAKIEDLGHSLILEALLCSVH